MNKKGQGAIIAMAIGAILLVVILGVIFSTLREQTQTTAVASDSFTSANETCTRVTVATSAIDCIQPGSTTAIVNDTNGADVSVEFAECGASGDIFGYDTTSQTNVSHIGVTINATYTARNCAFITSTTTRTLVNLIPVLLGIAILIFIVGFMALRR
ncbi:hypothetical protein LCGC14_0714790 [marine sediment metagenome]|uniref:Uncharacterized protein n=1 Tax=marine sediment metagenome TaxID=412755 RepID=A0A0F9QII2_9ZZZZ